MGFQTCETVLIGADTQFMGAVMTRRDGKINWRCGR